MKQKNGTEPITDPRTAVLAGFATDQFSMSVSDYPAGLRHDWHSHEKPILTLLLAGHARESVGSLDAVPGPLDVGLKPDGIRHTDHFWLQGVRALRIELCSPLVAQIANQSQTLMRWRWLSGSNAVRPLLHAADILLGGEPRGGLIEDAVYESLAALTVNKPSRSAAQAPLWLVRSRQHLEATYSNGIRLSHLASEAGVHPVYYARQFRRFFGCSVGEYAGWLQLRAAASLLSDSRVSLAHAANEAGYADQSHLTRTFAGRFGITPGRFRRLIT